MLNRGRERIPPPESDPLIQVTGAQITVCPIPQHCLQMAKTPCTSALILISSQPHYIVGKWQTQGGRTPALFFVYAAKFLHLCSVKPARGFPLARTEVLLIYRIGSHTNPKRRDFSLKQPGQKNVKDKLPEQRKGPKRAVECQLKIQTHIWEHDVGCSSHLTPTRKSRC